MHIHTYACVHIPFDIFACTHMPYKPIEVYANMCKCTQAHAHAFAHAPYTSMHPQVFAPTHTLTSEPEAGSGVIRGPSAPSQLLTPLRGAEGQGCQAAQTGALCMQARLAEPSVCLLAQAARLAEVMCGATESKPM